MEVKFHHVDTKRWLLHDSELFYSSLSVLARYFISHSSRISQFHYNIRLGPAATSLLSFLLPYLILVGILP